MIKWVIVFFLIGILGMLFVTPAFFYKGMMSIINGEVTQVQRILAWVPLYNTAAAESAYTGKVSKILIANIVTLLSGAVLFVMFAMNLAGILFLITAIVFLIMLVISWLVNSVVIFIILHESGCTTIGKTILLSLLYPLGQYYIGTSYGYYVNKMMKQESTF